MVIATYSNDSYFKFGQKGDTYKEIENIITYDIKQSIFLKIYDKMKKR